MNAQEHSLLTNLLNKLQEAARSSSPAVKDPEADRLITETLTASPDVAYLLVQRHLLLEMALERAQAQIKTMQTKEPGSFLGTPSVHASGNSVAQTNAYGQPVGQASPASVPPSTMAANTAPPSARPSFGGGSFLGTAAATATGVLGGALLFQGIEHLMGSGLNDGAMAGNQPMEDVTNITENVYGASPDTSADASAGGWDNGSMTNAGSGFDDPSANPIDPTQFDNGGLFDQANADDSGSGLFDGLFGGGDDDWI